MSKESADEDEERQKLSPERQHKVDQAADAAFKSMDADGDGKISYKEALNTFLKSLYK